MVFIIHIGQSVATVGGTGAVLIPAVLLESFYDNPVCCMKGSL